MVLRIIIGILTLLAVSLSVVATNPRWRSDLKRVLSGEQRKILAKAEANLQPGGPQMKIFKIKSGEEISLEIFSSPDGGSNFTLAQKITLEEKSDGYFNFQGNATNLALADIDNDSYFEIMAPTFDDQGVARLNTYKYDQSTHSFQKMDAQAAQ